jgi:hypothetical protein
MSAFTDIRRYKDILEFDVCRIQRCISRAFYFRKLLLMNSFSTFMIDTITTHQYSNDFRHQRTDKFFTTTSSKLLKNKNSQWS